MQLLFWQDSVSSPDDTKTIFLQLPQTQIELQFTQRPASMTYGDMSLAKYEGLLLETHDSILTSPYCGQDRWMDNHFAFETYVIPGLMDDIYHKLLANNIKFTVHKNVKEHTSDYLKHQLDLIEYDGEYTFGLWIIAPNGQSIKMGGVISEPSVAMYAGTNDPQWCEHECHWGLQKGLVDPNHIYVETMEEETNTKSKMKLKMNKNHKVNNRNLNVESNEMVVVVDKGDNMYIGLGMIVCVIMIFSAVFYYKHCVDDAGVNKEYSIVLNPI